MKEKLLQAIESLKEKKASFEDTVSTLSEFDYNAYNAVFNIDNIQVEKETYQRLLVFSNEYCCAILMLWGKKNQTAIHDHLNYDGVIKVLKGDLTEVSYMEEDSFIKFDEENVATEGAVFPEDLGGIHSVVNKSDTLSVSLHIYQTPQTSLKGVRLFDIENKRIAYLNEKATSCSWNLPKESFEKIVQI